MTRRWLLLGVFLLLAAGLMAVGESWTTEASGDPVNPALAARIIPGMPEADVEAMLGRPGDPRVPGVPTVLLHGAGVKYWQGGVGIIAVRFDKTGHVLESRYQVPPRPSWFRQVLSLGQW